MADWLGPLIQGAFIFLVSYAIVADLRDMRVPNWVPLAIGGLFLLHSLTLHSASTLPAHLLTGAAVLAGAFALFALGVFGGGDAKFLAALALWMGPGQFGPFLLLTALLGGSAAVAILALKRVLALNPALEDHAALAKPLAWARQAKLPYALPLGLAALLIGPALF